MHAEQPVPESLPMKSYVFLALAYLTLASAFAAQPASKYNVLFIISDGLNCDLDSYGTRESRRPTSTSMAPTELVDLYPTLAELSAWPSPRILPASAWRL
jgi:hypothetical protein